MFCFTFDQNRTTYKEFYFYSDGWGVGTPYSRVNLIFIGTVSNVMKVASPIKNFTFSNGEKGSPFSNDKLIFHWLTCENVVF